MVVRVVSLCSRAARVLAPGARALSSGTVAPPPLNAKASMQALQSLKGEVAVVTGAATGIGKAVAELYIEAGARVHAIDLAPCDLPGAASVHRIDVSNVKALTAAIQSAISSEGGRIDHCICSAGVWTYGDMDKTSEQEFDRVVAINIKGTFFTIAAVLPAMKAQKGGSIVIVGSDQSFVGKPGQNLYGLTKGAIAQLVKSSAAQYAPDGVRVNGVCPGTIDTPLMRNAVKQIAKLNGTPSAARCPRARSQGGRRTRAPPPRARAVKPSRARCDLTLRARARRSAPPLSAGQDESGEAGLVDWLRTAQPLPRLGETSEIALAIAMVSKVPFMTGALVPVDGGYTAQ
jgi:NAD(P)-dependent dehydrogenase (short-subunit alcohol dehydrogenase family)